MFKSVIKPGRFRDREGCETAAPTLFDGLGIESQLPGEPWSECSPPLHAVPSLKAVLSDNDVDDDTGRHNHDDDFDLEGDEIDTIEFRAPDAPASYDAVEPCDNVELDELDDDDDVEEQEPVCSQDTPSGKPMPPLPSPGQIARLGISTPSVVPRRIGRGRLVPARLTWKPGDPFAGETQESRINFRWELMLTAACVTAVCGLSCVWLLRTLLA